MMIYKLVHFSEPVVNIDVRVVMRDKELVKPLLQLFYNSKCSNNTLEEIVESLQGFLDDRNEVKRNSIDEASIGVVINLLSESSEYTLPSALIWKILIETLEGPGSYSPTKENKQNSEYEFSDYGLLYKTTIMKNILTIFGGEVRHGKTGNAIVFSKQKVDNLIKMRNERRIKVSEIDSSPTTTTNRCEDGEGSEGSIEGPPTFIEVYHGIEDNRIEVFPSISSQIMYSYSKDSVNVDSQCNVIQAIIVGHNTSLEPPEKKIKFTPDFKASEPVFWHVFKELSNDNNGLVTYDKLQERLISTGKLDAGGSVLMIEHMIETGKIEKTEHYHTYRISKPVSTKEEEWDNMR